MKRIVFAVLIGIFLNACMNDAPDPERFKIGIFEIPEGKGYEKTHIIRVDSLQIETYGSKTDTLLIRWKDNFNYTLLMLNPKNAVEEEPIHVKITDISRKSYKFEAVIGNSNFVQNGTLHIKEN